MITLFCIRPRGFNIGNDAIFVGLRHLIRETFDDFVNIVQIPATAEESKGLGGLLPKTVHEINQYAHGVIVGGGNLYENGQLDVDTNALSALRPPLMLFSLSHGRIYDHRPRLVQRTDSMPDGVIRALHASAAISVAREDATLAHLRALGLTTPVLGGCPSLLLGEVSGTTSLKKPGALLSVRHPMLMSIPLQAQARVHDAVLSIKAAMEDSGFGPVRILCHDTRDLAFAASLRSAEYVLADDIYSHLELLRSASLVVSFRLHAFLPCLAYGTPAINISYDERSSSLVRTIGMEDWDIDFVRSLDIAAEIRDRCHRLGTLTTLRERAQPKWRELNGVMRTAMRSFADRVTGYAKEQAPA
jgi:hypothetical protein